MNIKQKIILSQNPFFGCGPETYFFQISSSAYLEGAYAPLYLIYQGPMQPPRLGMPLQIKTNI